MDEITTTEVTEEITLESVNAKVTRILEIMETLQTGFTKMSENASKHPMLKMFIGNLGL